METKPQLHSKTILSSLFMIITAIAAKYDIIIPPELQEPVLEIIMIILPSTIWVDRIFGRNTEIKGFIRKPNKYILEQLSSGVFEIRATAIDPQTLIDKARELNYSKYRILKQKDSSIYYQNFN